jgi:hypothetical protein
MNIYQNTNHPHLYDCNLEGSPRHSLGSNNSSNLSTPPSPVREVGSSSYESWVVKRSFMLLLKSTYREEKSSERKTWTKKSERVRLLEICAVAVGLWGFHSQIQFYLNFTARFNWIFYSPNFALIFTTCIAFWDRAILYCYIGPQGPLTLHRSQSTLLYWLDSTCWYSVWERSKLVIYNHFQYYLLLCLAPYLLCSPPPMRAVLQKAKYSKNSSLATKAVHTYIKGIMDSPIKVTCWHI